MGEGRGNNGAIAIGLLIGGGYLAYRYIIQPNIIEPKKLQQYVKPVQVNLPTVRFKGDNLEFDAYLQNPNSTPQVIKAIVGSVWIIAPGRRINQKGKDPKTGKPVTRVVTEPPKRYKVGNVYEYGNRVIKPLGETKFTFSVRTRILGLAPLFLDIAQGKISGITVEFNGSINVNGRLWPVKKSVRLT